MLHKLNTWSQLKARPALRSKYYYQVQGQLPFSGLQWCDFITDTHTDFTVERIFRDEEIIYSVRQKFDNVYHNIYMDVSLSCKPWGRFLEMYVNSFR